ncbi:MFS transporter [Actinoallomurus soli]|uniref:MFS transporter n=1 Tax=Actinoallomurus soli TaxID=2952535 RepID=UPI00209373C8|nr:MFS transporter [Actinoallomurus soli]MCO5968957.1 MFS transporter [Actinoallomurus soli]
MVLDADARSIAARLDRLPVTRWHWMLIVVVGLGTFFDLYEVFLGGVLGAVLTEQWHLGTDGKSLVIASGFAGMFVGAIGLGVAADRFGRRRMFLVNLGLYSLLSLLTAFAPDLGAFLILRFLGGLALGAELTLVDTYVSEFMPRGGRGRYLAWAYTIGFCGVPVAAFLGGRFVAGRHLLIDGWRWLLVVGALGALIVWVLRGRLPESPRWLVAQGRTAEAQEIVARVEATADGPLPQVTADPDADAPAARAGVAEIFAGEYRRRTVMLWIFQVLQTVGYYGFGSLAPVVLHAKGFDVVQSLGYAAVSFIGYPVGSALSIPVIERVERKALIIGSALVMAAAGLVFGYGRATALIVVGGFVLTCASNVFSNAFHSYQAEIFPTGIRSSAISVAYSLSRATSAILPFVALHALQSLGAGVVFTGSAVVLVLLCLDVAVLGPRSTGRSLERAARPASVPTGRRPHTQDQ